MVQKARMDLGTRGVGVCSKGGWLEGVALEGKRTEAVCCAQFAINCIAMDDTSEMTSPAWFLVLLLA